MATPRQQATRQQYTDRSFACLGANHFIFKEEGGGPRKLM